MDSLLFFFKYFGLVIASCSSSIGIVSNFKKNDEQGNTIVTKQGKAAIILTALGLIISGTSIYLQDKKDVTKANQEILKENRKHFEELKISERENKNENEIMYSQIMLDRKQDKIHHLEDSTENLRTKSTIANQVKNLDFLFKQGVVEDYLNSSPEQVDLVLEMPYNESETRHLLDDSELTLDWSNNSNNYFYQVKGIFENPKTHNLYKWPYSTPIVFITNHSDTLKENQEIVSSEMSDSTFINEFNNRQERYVEFKEKGSKKTLVILNLNYFDFKKQPWEKISDFRGFRLYARLKSLYNLNVNLSSAANADGVGFSDSSLMKCLLRIDGRYFLKLGNAENLSNEIVSSDWGQFRKEIILKYRQK